MLTNGSTVNGTRGRALARAVAGNFAGAEEE
jgi:hypothetical protein